MNFSAKATRLVLEALDHYVEFLERRIETEELSEDELSDLTNDQAYLQSIVDDLKEPTLSDDVMVPVS